MLRARTKCSSIHVFDTRCITGANPAARATTGRGSALAQIENAPFASVSAITVPATSIRAPAIGAELVVTARH